MRLFIAAELPEEVVQALAETSALLRGCVRGRYVAPDSFHVTLAFLGKVETARVGSAIEALENGCRRATAFEAELGELGAFGRRSKTTLWQGFRDETAFRELAEAVRAALQSRDLPYDNKPFKAHVTLMRAADLTGGVLPSPLPACGLVERVSLFESDLSGEHPRYEALATCTLE